MGRGEVGEGTRDWPLGTRARNEASVSSVAICQPVPNPQSLVASPQSHLKDPMTTTTPIRSTLPSAPGFVPTSFGKGLAGQRSFAEALGAVDRAQGLDAREDRTPEARAREAAELLVSTTLIEPILKQAREANNAPPPFAPTQAEKQFGSLLDHRLAHEIVSSANFSIVDRLARNLLKASGVTA